MLPVYIFYSMFGFQRIGDLIWAAADQRARGFLFGATAGRTTLSGEGLQHQDGSSLLVAATVPSCRAYDPASAAEVAVILDHGMARMLDEKRDEFFYLTLMNEAQPQPVLPEGAAPDVVKGLYLVERLGPAEGPKLRLLGSGTILAGVRTAAAVLAEEHGVAVEVFSATSYSELARDAARVERHNRLAAAASAAPSHLDRLLPGTAPVVAASDHVRAVPQQIAPWIRGRFTVLGTDGFGRSSDRAALRRFFEVDSAHVVVAGLEALARDGVLPFATVAAAIRAAGIDAEAPPPWTV